MAEFYHQALWALDRLGISVQIQDHPNEVDPAIPFAEDTQHASYDPDAAHLFWGQLVQASRVMEDFRSHFVGKVSPVHFWGAMDLACTRFSGRPAPKHPGGAPNCGDWVMVEGYSRELSSCGFWPGGGEEGALYAYAYPEPDGFADYPVGHEAASCSRDNGQFLLPYEAVRTAEDPDRALLQFLHTSYEAAAERGGWDRAGLEATLRRKRAHKPSRCASSTPTSTRRTRSGCARSSKKSCRASPHPPVRRSFRKSSSTTRSTQPSPTPCLRRWSAAMSRSTSSYGSSAPPTTACP